jgi:hypothetical protein
VFIRLLLGSSQCSEKPYIDLYNILGGRPLHPSDPSSVPSSIHPSSSSWKKKMMEEEDPSSIHPSSSSWKKKMMEEEDEDEWQHQQFIQMFM